MSAVSSHFDVTPTLLALLGDSFELKMPKKVAWMGTALDTETQFRSIKDIPLMRNKNELKEYISGDLVYTDGDVMELDGKMDLSSAFSGGSKLESKLDNFKSMNAYVTMNNKIIPDSLAIFSIQKEAFTDSEIVWLSSVYNGQDSDKGYFTARDLAFDRKYEKALLLCRYNLSEAPSHIDTKILMGRINAWQGKHDEAIKILKECISKNPNYIDSYSALFDVYYWSDRYKEALELIELVQQNSSSAAEINDKIERARRQARKMQTAAYIKKHLKQQTETPVASLEF